MSKENTIIRIGNVAISIEGKTSGEIAPAYLPFIGRGKPDISLRFHCGIPEIVVGEKVFECPPIWTLYGENGTSVIRLFPEMGDLQRTLFFPQPLKNADLYFTNNCTRSIDPYFGPTIELLLMHYLAQERGVTLHACGIVIEDRGVLFLGESGTGKSTLARMWDQENDVDILSDDRVIVRKQGREFRVYGTPWHGEATFGSPREAKLERIFFLRQGQENSLKEMTGVDSLSHLLTCSFPPLWDSQAMEFVLEFFSQLAAQVPCQELSFRPEKSVLALVKKISK
ncbi:MAG: hypothetical protein P8075_15145 [Deltaproteobacteria bacterium]|jgi:hypothetical protein